MNSQRPNTLTAWLFVLVLFPGMMACQDGAPEATASQENTSEDTTEDVGPVPGQQAPDFTLTSARGDEYTLSDLRGEWVVLEWLNYDCPFVGKHYGGGNMPTLQEKYTGQGVVWLSIVSNAEGEQGYFEPAEMLARTEEEGGKQTAILYDTSGTVGRAYGATATPQMVVISPEGEIMYNGAIDDRPSTDIADLEGATDYLSLALDAAMAGEPVEVSRTEPYGCAIKYADELG